MTPFNRCDHKNISESCSNQVIKKRARKKRERSEKRATEIRMGETKFVDFQIFAFHFPLIAFQTCLFLLLLLVVVVVIFCLLSLCLSFFSVVCLHFWIRNGEHLTLSYSQKTGSVKRWTDKDRLYSKICMTHSHRHTDSYNHTHTHIYMQFVYQYCDVRGRSGYRISFTFFICHFHSISIYRGLTWLYNLAFASIFVSFVRFVSYRVCLSYRYFSLSLALVYFYHISAVTFDVRLVWFVVSEQTQPKKKNDEPTSHHRLHRPRPYWETNNTIKRQKIKRMKKKMVEKKYERITERSCRF